MTVSAPSAPVFSVPDFVPVFVEDVFGGEIPEDVKAHCNGSQQCIFDAVATGSLAVGQSTVAAFTTLQDSRRSLGKYRYDAA